VKPRFLLDEHVDRAIQRQLRRTAPQIEVLAIGDPEAPAPGASDPDLLIWLEANEYILVTEDRSTIPNHLAAHLTAGHQNPGILWIRPEVSLGAVIRELYLIWLASTAEEYQGQTLFIPL
jgi:predicted nuclease of predicted toxin-antitoxin system